MIADETTGAASWGLVMLADEPEALVMANLCWHLAQGVHEIHLYLDAPESSAARVLSAEAADLPGVILTHCDAGFWQRLNGGRPPLQTRRQTLVATQAYRRAGVDWLLHLDADEFLWLPPGRRFTQELAAVDDAPVFMALRNLERAYLDPTPETLFEGVFRVPLRAKDPLPAPLAYQAPFVARGVSGHAGGKACTRTGRGAVLQPHAPRVDGALPPATPAQDAVVLHFDGLTPLHWLIKLRRYAARDPAQWERFLAAHRRAQLLHMREHHQDPAALYAFHDRLKVAHNLPALETAGLVRRLEFDPAPALSQWLGRVPDLSCAAFNAALRAAFPGLAAGL